MPSFVDNFENDLFVSYAGVDDQAGWVSEFVADLGRRLSERLGRKASVSILCDSYDMAGDLNLEKQIAKSLETSACTLVVLSQGYMASQWCELERCHFLESIRQRNSAGGQIFVIERDWLRVGKPHEFQNMLSYRFWTGDPADNANLPRPLDRRRTTDLAKYQDAINRVVFALVAELSRQKSEKTKKEAGARSAEMNNHAKLADDKINRVTKSIQHKNDSRQAIKIFVSYSRDDLTITNEFLESLKRQLKPAKKFQFTFFKDDENILVGQNWRDEIDSALTNCDVGLLLLSPGFLGSEFIVDTELVRFFDSQKLIVPVLLDHVHPVLHDWKGLDTKQIFRLDTDRDGCAYARCDPQQKREFVQKLFERLVARLESASTGPA